MRRLYFNDYERLITTDLNAISTKIWKDLEDSYLRVKYNNTSGFLRGSMAPTYVSSIQVSIAAGRAFYYSGSVNYLVDTPSYTAMDFDGASTFSITSPHATLDRIDLIYATAAESAYQTATRDVKTGGVGPVASTTVNKDMRYLATITILAGTPNASPVAPSLPAGNNVAIGTIYVRSVSNGSGIANQAAITDQRVVFDSLDGGSTATTKNIGTDSATTTINIGHAGSTTNILGATTNVNVTNTTITDNNVILNYGGNDASAYNSGVTIARTSTSGSLIFNPGYTSSWACGILGSESEIVTVGAAQTITGAKTFTATVTGSSSVAANPSFISSASATTVPAYFSLKQAGTQYAYFGVDSSSAALITGASTSDLCFVAASRNINFSVDTGSHIHFKIASTGLATIGAASQQGAHTVNCDSLALTSISGHSCYVDLQIAGTEKAYIGVAGASGGLIAGSAIGDLCLAGHAQGVLISTDNGSTAGFKIDTNNNVKMGAANKQFIVSAGASYSNGGGAVFGNPSLSMVITGNSATRSITLPNANSSGLMIVAEGNSGASALVYFYFANGILLLSQAGGVFTTSAPSASQIQITCDSTNKLITFTLSASTSIVNDSIYTTIITNGL